MPFLRFLLMANSAGGAGGHRTLLIFGHKSPHVIHYSNRSIYLSSTPERRGDGGRFSGIGFEVRISLYPLYY